MKVAHITTTLTGGAGIAAFRIHLSLLDNGVESSLMQKHPLIDEYKNLNVYRCTHFHPLSYRIINKLHLTPYLTTEGAYIKVLSKYPPINNEYEIATLPISYFKIEEHPMVKVADIVHLHWVGNFLNYPSFFKNVKQPIVWTLHDMNPFQGIFHYGEDILRNQSTLGRLERKAILLKNEAIHLKKNIHIVCLCEWMKQRSEASATFNPYPHTIIPNGLDFSNYPVLDKKLSREKLGIDNDLKTIFFIASNLKTYRKGFDLLQDTIRQIKGAKFNLLTLGNESVNVDSSKVNHIHFESTSDIEKINMLYSVSDATVLPSREDNLPNVMLESFANGTPVISFANGGMADHVKTGETGILLNEINSSSLADGINALLNDKYDFKREKIINYAKETFSKELQAERYMKLYNDILNR